MAAKRRNADEQVKLAIDTNKDGINDLNLSIPNTGNASTIAIDTNKDGRPDIEVKIPAGRKRKRTIGQNIREGWKNSSTGTKFLIAGASIAAIAVLAMSGIGIAAAAGASGALSILGLVNLTTESEVEVPLPPDQWKLVDILNDDNELVGQELVDSQLVKKTEANSTVFPAALAGAAVTPVVAGGTMAALSRKGAKSFREKEQAKSLAEKSSQQYSVS